jgi:hypothetical protein
MYWSGVVAQTLKGILSVQKKPDWLSSFSVEEFDSGQLKPIIQKIFLNLRPQDWIYSTYLKNNCK